MYLKRKFSLFLLLFLTLTTCSERHKLGGMTSVYLRAPSDPHMLATLPSGRKACYGVSVRGAGITSRTGNSCSPPTGVISGFVEAGSSMSLEIPKGTGRTFDLILYLKPLGDSSSCPTFGPAFSNAQLSSTYLVGSVSSVDLSEASTNIVIKTTFPGLAQNITYQMNMSGACQAMARPEMPPSPYSISAGGDQTVTGGGYKIHAHVGSPYRQTVLSGAGYKLIIR